MLLVSLSYRVQDTIHEFQRAPTLEGECYYRTGDVVYDLNYLFQWAPTLGGECYDQSKRCTKFCAMLGCFNGHPPLRVNATGLTLYVVSAPPEFQWAPTLGGECYMRDEVMHIAYNYHFYVSMGTHPWG